MRYKINQIISKIITIKNTKIIDSLNFFSYNFEVNIVPVIRFAKKDSNIAMKKPYITGINII